VIEIYSSSHCVECQRALRELSSMGVEVRSVSKETAKERLALGTPTLWLVVNGQIKRTYFGWQRSLIERDIQTYCGKLK
jgi:glutaredoxin